MRPSRPRILYVVTHGVTANILLRGQLRFLRDAGYDVHVAGGSGRDLDEVRRREGVEVHPIAWTRAAVDPTSDLRGLATLTAIVRQIRPHIVNASTPKGGLYGALSALAVRVPVRIYLLRGLRLETTKGLARRALGMAETLAAAASHEVVCVSESLRRAFVDGGYASRPKTTVLGPGSSNGVDLARFCRTASRDAEARALRERLGIAPGAKVIGFVGRLVGDKGCDDLLRAFETARRTTPHVRLLLVGADLGDETMDPVLRGRLDALGSGVVLTSRVDDVAPYYACMNVLAFPSRREGLPNVPLEAACAGVPTVGYSVTGVVDAVADGDGGMLVDVRDPRGFSEAVQRYVEDDARAKGHGAFASRWVERFDQAKVHERWLAYYEGWLSRRCPP